MSEREEPWSLVIGRVTAPFGTKGEVRVRPETDFPERFRKLDEVCLELPSGEERVARVAGARVTPKGILLKLEGCEDRDAAEGLRRALVKVKPSMAAPLPEGSYWVHEIVGLRVFTEKGKSLGEVTEVVRSPGNDVYVTPSAMIPAVRQVVREIDLEGGRMVVALPPDAESDGGEE
ncbi:MAG: 16S rRNA processing protein RimM [Armatimonadota bacterium]|nr:MAG: 16S rRNA processing protein RimM [Armatimonadota bacterium]